MPDWVKSIDYAELMDYVIVIAFGALVGAGELISRYRDAPVSAVRTLPGYVYMGLNAASAAAVLALIRAFGWRFGLAADTSATAVRWTQLLVAGFGAMAVFRSSLFTVRAGDKDIGVGPAIFLQVALDAADREVDRNRGGSRSKVVSELMNNVSFSKASVTLPALCLALMQNLSKDEQEKLAQGIRSVASQTTLSDQARANLLGLALLNVVGEDVLRGAITDFKRDFLRARKIIVKPTPVPPMKAGSTLQLLAEATDGKDPLSGDGVVWTSEDSNIASVTTNGLLQCVAKGSCIVVARLDGIEDRVQVTVS